MRVKPCDQRMFGRILRNWRRRCQGLPEEVRNLVTFKAAGVDKTEVKVKEYDWPVGHMMGDVQNGHGTVPRQNGHDL